MVECLRKVVAGETWLDSQGIRWVMQAYRSQGNRPTGSRPKVQLTPKETLIVSCVTQGMKNKEIALRVGTTEQVVKNYLRKVYDKLGVADRLELALYCLNHHVVDNTKVPALPASASNGDCNERQCWKRRECSCSWSVSFWQSFVQRGDADRDHRFPRETVLDPAGSTHSSS